MSNKKLLITGSCGFIFSNFVRKFIFSKGKVGDDVYSVVSVDMVQKNISSIYQNKSHTFYVGDIRDQHLMDVIFSFEKPDVVIHGAAETFVDSSLKDPNSFVSSNVLGTQTVINCCVKYNVEKLIYISTDEVYGQLTNENDAAWTETSPLNPRNPYSASKAAGELLVQAAHHSHGLTYNITRSANNYGPRQNPEKLIPKAIKNILKDRPIPIYGQGLQMRDWTHVYDNCSGLITVLGQGKPNEIYNISANQEFTNIEVINEICKCMGKGHELIQFIEDPRGTGHDFRYAIDSSKLKDLGWKPNIKLKKDLKEQCVQWYMDNQWFLK